MPAFVPDGGDLIWLNFDPQDSLPWDAPQSVSRWRFPRRIPATSLAREYFGCRDRSTMLPSPARSSDNRSPSASRASLTIACGILTAKLFPHLATCVSFGIWIYIEYTGSTGSFSTGTRDDQNRAADGDCILEQGDRKILPSNDSYQSNPEL